MIRCESLKGPVFFGEAVVIDGRIAVAVVWPNIRLALRDKMAGWTALQHGFPAAKDVNRYVGRRASGEI